MSTTKKTGRSPRSAPRRKAEAATGQPTSDSPRPDPADPARDHPDGEHALEQTLAALEVDEGTAHRIQQLPHDVGWLLVTAGVVGVVMPGVLGLPFLALGGLILWPGNNRRAERWLSGHSPTLFKGSMRQISRFLDDLEQRYPQNRRK